MGQTEIVTLMSSVGELHTNHLYSYNGGIPSTRNMYHHELQIKLNRDYDEIRYVAHSSARN